MNSNTKKKKILFYCQPVLGIGHFIRSRAIVQGLGDFEVCFVNGGEIVRGLELPDSVELVNLPALKSDAEFQSIHVADTTHNLEQVKAIRQELILSTFERVKPDILLIELFPFGRRKFEFELMPLLERIRSEGRPTKVVCSLRDILVSKRKQAQYEEEVCSLMNQYFDLLLIHADPGFQRLEETFPALREIKCEIRYTGFVIQKAEEGEFSRPDSEEAFIVVSIGGGRVGLELLECAVEASDRIGEDVPHRMHIVTGPLMPEEQFLALEQKVEESPRITIQRYTTQFINYLRQADLSISMAGYNTCMDILTTGVRALVFPFAGNGNQEQTVRARKLEKMGLVRIVDPLQLEPGYLAEEIARSLQNPRKAPIPILDMRGVERTAEFLARLCALAPLR